jgi:hypothetical protein
MSASGRGAGTAQRLGSGSVRVLRFWRGLPSERRLAAGAAVGLFVTLFLPWYQETVIATGVHSLRSYGEGLSGWAAFSFVEAAVLLVAAAVLVLLFVRAEGAAFHVPGGDGGVITAAGLWTCALIVWRIFDKEGTTGHGQLATTWGIEWGIFIALAVGALLAYAGTRIRHAHEPEPPLPGERAPRVPVSRERSAGGRARPTRGPEMEIDDTWTARSPGQGSPAAEEPQRRVRPRSVGAPRGSSAELPGGPSAPSSPPVTDPTVVRAPDSPQADRPRRSRGLDRREIQELDIAEPPTARLGRSRPRPRPAADDPEDQLTIRLDRPD